MTRIYTDQKGYKHGAPMELTENEIGKGTVDAARWGHRAYKYRDSCRPGSLTRRLGICGPSLSVFIRVISG